MITTQTADSVLKSYYLDVVSEQLDKSANPLLAQIEKTSADVWGKDVRKIVRYGVNGGVGAGTEEGKLPAAKGNNYAQFVTPLKNLYGTIEISDKAIRSSANSEGAFVNLLNDEMDGLVKSSAFNFGRMLYGDGTGRLTYLMEVKGDSVTCLNAKNLYEGMVVDIYTSAGEFFRTSTILTVNRSDNSIKLDGEKIESPSGYSIYVQGSKDNEITGLHAIFNSYSLYGVNRAENRWMLPILKQGIGEITESVLQTTLDEIEETTGNKINFIVCSMGVRRALIEALSAYRTLEPMELTGGFRALSYNGIPIVADRFCPEGTMYLLNTNDFALHQLCDWQWLEGEDGKILKQIPGKPVYTATLVKYAELMCYRPGGQAMLSGITEK